MVAESLVIRTDSQATLPHLELAPPAVVPHSSTSVATWSLGLSTFGLLSWLYDYVFYSAVIWWFGFAIGAVILTLLTAVLDYYCLKFYYASKNDWLALEYLKSLKTYTGSSRIKRGIGYVLRSMPPFFQIIVLTPYSTAFLTTAFLRNSAYDYSNLTRRDWHIFWTSFVFSQLYWISLVGLGVEGVSELIAYLAKVV